jgi:hyperosmotically inducible protein
MRNKTLHSKVFAGAAGFLLAATLSCGAWAQSDTGGTGDAGGAANTADSGGATNAPSKKAMRAANRKLERDVRRALIKAHVDIANLNVLVKGGSVTLAGSVPDGSQLNAAGDAAKTVAGVTDLNNRLSVRAIGH